MERFLKAEQSLSSSPCCEEGDKVLLFLTGDHSCHH